MDEKMDVASAGGPIAHLAPEFVGEDVADHGLVSVSGVKNPVGFLRHTEQGELRVLAIFVLQFEAVGLLLSLCGTAAANAHFGATMIG